jgi:hypothetical protein
LLELQVLKNKFVAYSKVLHFYMFEKEQNQHEGDCEHHLNTRPSVEAKQSYASEPKEMAYGKELQSTVRENTMLVLSAKISIPSLSWYSYSHCCIFNILPLHF